MSDKIHISQLFGAESINKINIDLEKHLSSKGFDVTHSQIPKTGEVLIQHFYNAHVIERAGYRFKKTILIQPIDGDVLKKEVTDVMNKYDLIITPSNTCKNIFINNGVEKEIIVIPNYYDDSILDSDNGYYSKNYASSKYTFYSESTGIKRKNLVNILKHYLAEFNAEDNVRLILKITTKDRAVVNELSDMMAFAVMTNQAPEVIIINEFLSEDDLNSLRLGIDCYICLSYMEGFCIPLLNAIVIKKDVICLNTKISGYADFVNVDNAYMLDVKRVPMDKSVENMSIYSADSQWEEPDYNEYKRALRCVFEKKYNFKKEAHKYHQYSQRFIMEQYVNVISNQNIPSVVKSPTSLAMWQIYYNDEGLKRLDKKFLPYDNRGKTTFLFENEVIIDIWKNNKDIWRTADYVGVVSWMFTDKTSLKGEDVQKFIDMQVDKKDVYSMSPHSAKNYPSPFSETTFGHINEICMLIDKHNVFPFKVRGFNSQGKCKIFCNYFLCTPEIFDDYVGNYLNKLLTWFNTCQDERLAYWLRLMIPHRNTLHPIHTFIMEGLFECYVDYMGYSYGYVESDATRKGLIAKNVKPATATANEPSILPLKTSNTIIFPSANISESKKDIYIFFHICCMGNYVEVTNEIIDEIINSGLYDKCKKVFYSIIESPAESITSRLKDLDKFELIYSDMDIKNVEYPTLSILQEFCANKDLYVLYLHTKGVSVPKDKYRQLWRKRLLQTVVKEHEVCVSLLNEGCDIAGCGWKQDVKTEQKDYFAGKSEHFSGNFWWATSQHISKLPSLKRIQSEAKGKMNPLDYRVECEYWIGYTQYIHVGISGDLNKEYSKRDFYTPAIPEIIYTEKNGILPDGFILTRYKTPKFEDRYVKVRDVYGNEHIGVFKQDDEKWVIPRKNGASVVKGEIVCWKD